VLIREVKAESAPAKAVGWRRALTVNVENQGTDYRENR
jgi:hypothetical protein